MGRWGAFALVLFMLSAGCASMKDGADKAECDDGIDNDGDGKIDHKLLGRGDSDCESAKDDSEAPASSTVPGSATPTSSALPSPTAAPTASPPVDAAAETDAPLVINELLRPQAATDDQPARAGFVEVLARRDFSGQAALVSFTGDSTRPNSGITVALPATMAKGERFVVQVGDGDLACAPDDLSPFLLTDEVLTVWDHASGQDLDAVAHYGRPAFFVGTHEVRPTPLPATTAASPVIQRSPDGRDTDRTEDFVTSTMATPCAPNGPPSSSAAAPNATTAQPPTETAKWVVNELRAGGAYPYVELMTTMHASADGLVLVIYRSDGTEAARIALAGWAERFLVVDARGLPGHACTADIQAPAFVPPSTSGAVAILGEDGVALDVVAYGHFRGTQGEGQPALSPNGMTIARIPDGVDTNDNASDLRRAEATPCAPNR